MGFDCKWVEVILRCVSTVSYSVLLNAIPQNPFTPSRGIRQGDPLSLYVFILCAESLSKLIQHVEGSGAIIGVPLGRNQVRISHLFFADDGPGLPVEVGRSKTKAFRSVIDKVRRRISNWKMKYLSQWGQKAEERKIYRCHWDKMCKAKAVGGLGFRDLEHFNLVMLAKQGWRLLHFLDSLAAKALSSKYYPDGQFLKATITRHPSLIWRSIRPAKPLLEEGLF
ncbi:uncharacterized protein LOC122282276 [Carya illinoinensis]|uniref:uncharacterized protein LOC122282276 n=1 Tax=Carya illinoinensis TaxID=32201 RepID=UPI001C71D4EA|nr:uncharacterized protein LOC122282276 [Carya illinoinensis]